jgi:hypothetical protein
MLRTMIPMALVGCLLAVNVARTEEKRPDGAIDAATCDSYTAAANVDCAPKIDCASLEASLPVECEHCLNFGLGRACTSDFACEAAKSARRASCETNKDALRSTCEVAKVRAKAAAEACADLLKRGKEN